MDEVGDVCVHEALFTCVDFVKIPAACRMCVCVCRGTFISESPPTVCAGCTYLGTAHVMCEVQMISK